jgi:predicted RNase H-like nuclease (RuvC/YqgF family)
LRRKDLKISFYSEILKLEKLRDALIVGVDPGSTFGLCVIDIFGNYKGIFSLRILSHMM